MMKEFGDKDQAKPDQPVPPWEPKDWVQFVGALKPFADIYRELTSGKQTYDAKRVKIEADWQLKVTRTLLAFTGGVVGLLGVLVWLGSVDGTAFLFAVGIVIGALFTLIQRQLFGGLVVEPEQLEQ